MIQEYNSSSKPQSLKIKNAGNSAMTHSHAYSGPGSNS